MIIDMTERDVALLRRLLDMLQNTPPDAIAAAVNRRQDRPSPGAIKSFVEITSTTQSDGRYPGTTYDRYDQVNKTWTEGGTCWVVDSLGTVLSTGQKYEGRLVGYAGTPERAVYMTDRDVPGAITVREQDGSPSVSASTVTFDQADGFVVTNLGSGEAQVDQTPASVTTVGYVTIGAQTIRGPKTIDTNGAGTDELGFSYVSGGFMELSGPGDPGVVNRLCVMQINADYYSMPTADQTYWRTIRNGSAWPCGIRFYDPYTSGTPSFGLLVSNGPYWMLDYSADTFTPPTVILNWTDLSSVQHTEAGQTGTFGGLEFVGGFLVGGSLSAPVAIGDPVSGGTSGGVLLSDSSGNLDDSADFTFDDTGKSLTLGNQGYLITTKTSAPSGIPTDSIAGPFFGS